MRVWNGLIKDKTKETLIISGVKLNVEKYSTTIGNCGIGISLADNSECNPSFRFPIGSLLIKFQNKMNLQKTTKELSFQQMLEKCQDFKIFHGIGFYFLEDFLIFEEWTNADTSKTRIQKFIEILKKF